LSRFCPDRLKKIGKVAPQAGFEPATLRLTAGCSTVELLRNVENVNEFGTASPLGKPRAVEKRISVYQTIAFSHSATSPRQES
jgi:hypothetical protein